MLVVSEVRIYWDDLDFPDQPGEYLLKRITVVVTLGEIEIWEDHPDASFELFRTNVDGAPLYSLWLPYWTSTLPARE